MILNMLIGGNLYLQHSSDQKLVVVEVNGRITRRNTQRTTDDQHPSVLSRSQHKHRIREYTYTVSRSVLKC